MTVATAMAVELYRAGPVSRRADLLFKALTVAATGLAIDLVPTTTYQGHCSHLLLWGPGAPNRLEAIAQHRAMGGHVIAWDLAYWDRDHKNRVSFDAPHPQAYVMRRDLPADRFDADRIPVGDYWNPDGPVLVAGIGQKAMVQYGDVVGQWEREQIALATALGRDVLYRPKRDGRIQPGTRRAPSGVIDEVLKGCSRVITWHSNVAVDAIRMGIPVVCKDGAAAAVCPSSVAPEQAPLPDSWRQRFLENLAWFQWRPDESAQFWRFLQETCA